MFTGIVETLGRITDVTRGEESAVFTFDLADIVDGLLQHDTKRKGEKEFPAEHRAGNSRDGQNDVKS